MILSPNEIAWCALNAGWKGQDVAIAVAVALAESKGNTEALGWVPGTANKPASGNYDHGLFQISSLWHGSELLLAGADWRNPVDNAIMAFHIWAKGNGKGWAQWSTYTGGAYQLLLPFGDQAAKYPWAPPSAKAPTVTLTGGVNLPAIPLTIDVSMPATTGEIHMQGPIQ